MNNLDKQISVALRTKTAYPVVGELSINNYGHIIEECILCSKQINHKNRNKHFIKYHNISDRNAVIQSLKSIIFKYSREKYE